MKKCLVCYNDINEPSNLTEYHAKCCKKLFAKVTPPKLEYTLKDVKKLAEQNVVQSLAVPGVQPKLSLTIDDKKLNDSRLTIVGLWNGLFILKPPTSLYPELPEVESLTMKLAEICDINTAVYGLVRFKSGELAYLSKRFDRTIKRNKVIKHHQEDMCQLSGLLTENKYNGSMENVVKIINNYTDNTGLELINLYKIILFSFLTGNADMHLKNFSLSYSEDGKIGLSPAYDLVATKIVMENDQEEMALTINGKKTKLRQKDFNSFAEYCKITTKVETNIKNEFEIKLPIIKKTIKNSFISNENKAKFLTLIKQRCIRAGISLPENYTNND